MRGVIVSQRDGAAYILAEGGIFISSKQHAGVPIGTEVDVEYTAVPQFKLRSVLIAVAAAITLALGSAWTYFYALTASYISIDINPSVELAVNNMGSVKSVRGLNADGEALLKGMKSEKTPGGAVLQILDRANSLNYIHDGTHILIGFTSSGGMEKLLKETNDAVNSSAYAGKVSVYTGNAADRNRAAELSVSAGELLAAHHLAEIDPSLAVEQILSYSVAEIMDAITAARAGQPVSWTASQPSTEPTTTADTSTMEPATESSESLSDTETVEPTAEPTTPTPAQSSQTLPAKTDAPYDAPTGTQSLPVEPYTEPYVEPFIEPDTTIPATLEGITEANSGKEKDNIETTLDMIEPETTATTAEITTVPTTVVQTSTVASTTSATTTAAITTTVTTTATTTTTAATTTTAEVTTTAATTTEVEPPPPIEEDTTTTTTTTTTTSSTTTTTEKPTTTSTTTTTTTTSTTTTTTAERNSILVPVSIFDQKEDGIFFEGSGGMSIRGKISPHLSAENLPYLPGDYDEGTIPVSDENFHRYFHEVDGESLKLGGQLLMTASTVDGKKFWNFSSNEFFAANVASDGDEGYYFSEVNDSSGEPFITEGAAKARQVYDLSNGDTGFNADPRKPIRNYHFTMAMDAAFTYRGGEIFDLSGDDDVWVYIRDPRTGESVLALDLGGAHGTESGSFALDALQDFTFEEGTTYNLCLFFSERHTTGSTLSFTTSIDFQ